VAQRLDITFDEMTDEEQTSCEAMLLFWYVTEGDSVAEGEDLAEIETAKAVVVVKAPAAGTLRDVLVREGDAVAPAQKLATLECPD